MGNKNPQRIVFFIPTLKGGGAERVMVTFANAFAKKGIETDLVVCSLTGPYVDEVDKSVNIVDLGTQKVSRSVFSLLRYIRDNKPSAMVSCQAHANIFAVIAKLLSRQKFKLAIREANTPSVSGKAGNSRYPIKTFLVSALQKKLYKYADFVIAPSKGVAGDLVKNNIVTDSKVKVIHNPLDIQTIQEKAKTPVSHPWMNGSDPVILAAGRLTKQKDYPTLLKAFGIIAKRIPCKLVILGEGEKRTELENLIKELNLQNKVDMPGFVENPFAFMSKASLFVLSSLWEGLPNVLIQAMACGTPVVATDCPSGPREILENGKYGQLVPPGDVKTLAEAMYENLLSKHDMEKALERARFFSAKKATVILQDFLGVNSE